VTVSAAQQIEQHKYSPERHENSMVSSKGNSRGLLEKKIRGFHRHPLSVRQVKHFVLVLSLIIVARPCCFSGTNENRKRNSAELGRIRRLSGVNSHTSLACARPKGCVPLVHRHPARANLTSASLWFSLTNPLLYSHWHTTWSIYIYCFCWTTFKFAKERKHKASVMLLFYVR
jgi:hypothetical protein